MYYDLSNPQKNFLQDFPSLKPQQNSSLSNPQTNEHSQLSFNKSSDPDSKKIFRAAKTAF